MKTPQRHSNYFEAIIQLRPKNPEMLDKLLKIIEKNEANISKIVEQKFGYDVYIDSRKVAVQIGKSMKRSHKCEMKISKTLHSRDRTTSKLRYRVTILLRFNTEKDIND